MSALAEQWSGDVVASLPPCPAWCEGHDDVADEVGGEHTHRGMLYGFDLRIDGVLHCCTIDVAQDERVDWATREVVVKPPLVWVSFDSDDGRQRAVVDVELEGAEGARALAAALIAAADVIEGRSR